MNTRIIEDENKQQRHLFATAADQLLSTMGLPPTAVALPDALVDREQWVCWRAYERDGKPTKTPVIPGTTQFASTTDPDTWRDFETAREAVTATRVAGLGFVFTADDPLIGIDLDDCRDPDTGDPTEWASAIIADVDSYTEVSPSGTGYHILVSGTLPDGRNRAGDLEVYDRSRFFTVTGDHVSETPAAVRERTEAIETLHETAVAADPTGASSDADETAAAAGATPSADDTVDPTGVTALSDEELLSRAKHAANGEKFMRLWNGTTSGYESHSEADMALCRLLAFWTGCDGTRIDRLFRQSGLYRDKWETVHYADGSTYGEKTVERAIAHTDDVYTPPETESRDQAAAADAPASGPTDQSAMPSGTDHTGSPATATPADSTVPSDPSTSTADETRPPSRSRRAEDRRERIEELTDRVEALLAENERLRAELQAERNRREELETAIEKTESGGWWPFSRDSGTSD